MVSLKRFEPVCSLGSPIPPTGPVFLNAKTQGRKEVVADVVQQCRRLTAEPPAIVRSPATGRKSAGSGCEHPSPSDFPPADAPGARRFRLPPIRGKGGTPPNHKMKGRSGEACALGARAGGWGTDDDRLRSESAPCPPVPGRRPTAGTSPRDELWAPALPPLCESA